jgi:transketolase
MFCGPIGSEVVKAADMLEKDGIKCRLVSMHTIKPIDKDAIIDAVKNTGGILTVEEHNIIGGLGSAVAEVLADEGLTPKAFKRLAFPDVNIAKIGGQNWIRDQYGLQANGIADSVKKILK